MLHKIKLLTIRFLKDATLYQFITRLIDIMYITSRPTQLTVYRVVHAESVVYLYSNVH